MRYQIFAVLSCFVCLTGCATNGFEKYYSPQPGSESVLSSPYVDKPLATPKVYAHSNDTKADAKRLAEDGYILLGTSSFFGPANRSNQAQAIAQGKKVGASLIMVSSSYRDTLNGAIPYTVANPTQYATVNTNGTVNSYGSGGYANGTYNSTSTVAVPGGYSTYSIPYSVTRNDFFASYWARRSPEKMRLGVNPVPLPDEVRSRLQRNTGVFVPIVIRGTPAFSANVLEGDVIVKINGTDVVDPKGFTDQLTQFAGQAVDLSIIRGSEPISIHVTLNPNPPGLQ